MPLKCTADDKILGAGHAVASGWVLRLKKMFTYVLYRRSEGRKMHVSTQEFLLMFS